MTALIQRVLTSSLLDHEDACENNDHCDSEINMDVESDKSMCNTASTGFKCVDKSSVSIGSDKGLLTRSNDICGRSTLCSIPGEVLVQNLAGRESFNTDVQMMELLPGEISSNPSAVKPYNLLRNFSTGSDRVKNDYDPSSDLETIADVPMMKLESERLSGNTVTHQNLQNKSSKGHRGVVDDSICSSSDNRNCNENNGNDTVQLQKVVDACQAVGGEKTLLTTLLYNQVREQSDMNGTKLLRKDLLHCKAKLGHLQSGIESRMELLCGRTNVVMDKMTALGHRLVKVSRQSALTFNEMLNECNKIKYYLTRSCMVFEEVDKLIGAVHLNMFDYIRATTELGSEVDIKLRELGCRSEEETGLGNSSKDTLAEGSGKVVFNQRGLDVSDHGGIIDVVCHDASTSTTFELRDVMAQDRIGNRIQQESKTLESNLLAAITSFSQSRDCVKDDLSSIERSIQTIFGQMATILWQAEGLGKDTDSFLFKTPSKNSLLKAENSFVRELAKECLEMFRNVDFLCKDLMKLSNLYAYLNAFSLDALETFLTKVDP